MSTPAVECTCGAQMAFIPLLEIGKIIPIGFGKRRQLKKPLTPPFEKDFWAGYERCLWCGRDFSEVVAKLKQVETLVATPTAEEKERGDG